MTKDYSETLPDRNDTDIPEQVQWFLSFCELACVWRIWLEDSMGSEEDQFCEGVTDYWWEYDTLEEPTMDMLHRIDMRSKERVAYQKGAMVGYELAERFKDGRQT